MVDRKEDPRALAREFTDRVRELEGQLKMALETIEAHAEQLFIERDARDEAVANFIQSQRELEAMRQSLDATMQARNAWVDVATTFYGAWTEARALLKLHGLRVDLCVCECHVKGEAHHPCCASCEGTTKEPPRTIFEAVKAADPRA